jgi:peptidyl-tRNA hydrolase
VVVQDHAVVVQDQDLYIARQVMIAQCIHAHHQAQAVIHKNVQVHGQQDRGVHVLQKHVVHQVLKQGL